MPEGKRPRKPRTPEAIARALVPYINAVACCHRILEHRDHVDDDRGCSRTVARRLLRELRASLRSRP